MQKNIFFRFQIHQKITVKLGNNELGYNELPLIVNLFKALVWFSIFCVTVLSVIASLTVFLCYFYHLNSSFLSDFRFGCCSDGETPANGPDGEGCDENRQCSAGKFGCCPDKVTFAQGPNKQGCFECPEEVRHF
jgi:hypothetical protein